MESAQRLALASALGIIVIALAAASDFVVGSFWSRHAMLTSLLASLLVLGVTVVIVNEVLDRRQRRRWTVLGQYVLFQLVQSARATWVGLVEIGGLGDVDAGSTAGLQAGALLALDTARITDAMGAALASPALRREVRELIVAVGTHGRALVATWAPLMVDAGPYAPLFDRHVELQSRTAWIAEVLEPGALTEWLPVEHDTLVRSSVAGEHAAQFDDVWLRSQLVSTAQLAVQLDFESRRIGFKLVSYESWTRKINNVDLDVPELG